MSKHPRFLPIGDFHDRVKEYIRDGDLRGAEAYILLRYEGRKGPAQLLFRELTEEVDVEKQIERDLILEGLDAESEDPESEVFVAPPDVIEALQSQGIVASSGDENDDPDEGWNPFDDPDFEVLDDYE